MAIFEPRNWLRSVSRKIWVVEKILNFHIVWGVPIRPYINRSLRNWKDHGCFRMFMALSWSLSYPTLVESFLKLALKNILVPNLVLQQKLNDFWCIILQKLDKTGFSWNCNKTSTLQNRSIGMSGNINEELVVCHKITFWELF